MHTIIPKCIKSVKWLYSDSSISHICRNAPNGATVLNFGMLEDIADVITHTKFFVNRFRGFGVLTFPNLCISIGWLWSLLQQCKH